MTVRQHRGDSTSRPLDWLLVYLAVCSAMSPLLVAVTSANAIDAEDEQFLKAICRGATYNFFIKVNYKSYKKCLGYSAKVNALDNGTAGASPVAATGRIASPEPRMLSVDIMTPAKQPTPTFNCNKFLSLSKIGVQFYRKCMARNRGQATD